MHPGRLSRTCCFVFKELLGLCFSLKYEAICAGSQRRKDFGTKGHGSSLISAFRGPCADLPGTSRSRIKFSDDI